MDEHLIDDVFLSSLREDVGNDIVDRLISTFLLDCEMLTADILQAYQKAHFSEVELEAHALGSAAAACGAVELESICREIELAQPIKTKIFNDRIQRFTNISKKTIESLNAYTAI